MELSDVILDEESGPVLVLDHEELDLDRQYDGPVDFNPLGFSFRCPRCEGMKTAYSVLEEDWVCLDCRLIFSRELAEIFNQLRINDKGE